jgi:hypothetical protein
VSVTWRGQPGRCYEQSRNYMTLYQLLRFSSPSSHSSKDANRIAAAKARQSSTSTGTAHVRRCEGGYGPPEFSSWRGWRSDRVRYAASVGQSLVTVQPRLGEVVELGVDLEGDRCSGIGWVEHTRPPWGADVVRCRRLRPGGLLVAVTRARSGSRPVPSSWLMGSPLAPHREANGVEEATSEPTAWVTCPCDAARGGSLVPPLPPGGLRHRRASLAAGHRG